MSQEIEEGVKYEEPTYPCVRWNFAFKYSIYLQRYVTQPKDHEKKIYFNFHKMFPKYINTCFSTKHSSSPECLSDFIWVKFLGRSLTITDCLQKFFSSGSCIGHKVKLSVWKSFNSHTDTNHPIQQATSHHQPSKTRFIYVCIYIYYVPSLQIRRKTTKEDGSHLPHICNLFWEKNYAMVLSCSFIDPFRSPPTCFWHRVNKQVHPVSLNSPRQKQWNWVQSNQQKNASGKQNIPPPSIP